MSVFLVMGCLAIPIRIRGLLSLLPDGFENFDSKLLFFFGFFFFFRVSILFFYLCDLVSSFPPLILYQRNPVSFFFFFFFQIRIYIDPDFSWGGGI